MYGASYYNDNGTLKPISDLMRGNNSPVFSHVGQIIHSTTLSTLAKVQEVYGADTTWIRHDGYFLRGASSGVTANNPTSTGGSDNAIVVSHSHHTINSSQNILATTKATVNGGGAGWTIYKPSGYLTNPETETVGSSGTNANIPKYKSVYIWERTA
jgi:hypothetical protein